VVRLPRKRLKKPPRQPKQRVLVSEGAEDAMKKAEAATDATADVAGKAAEATKDVASDAAKATGEMAAKAGDAAKGAGDAVKEATK
jgi:hypothetical protein